MKIVLASQSPRRKELLGRLGLEFTTISPEIDERALQGPGPRDLVCALSRAKALQVAKTCSSDTVVLGADTVVVLDGLVLGKPRDRQEAENMLAALSGRTHQVFTGVTLCRGGQVLTEAEETLVTFRSLTGEEICQYAASGEGDDKAGAYGIQGLGSLLIQGIQGDYSNVVGLPLCLTGQLLKQVGIDCLALGEASGLPGAPGRL